GGPLQATLGQASPERTAMVMADGNGTCIRDVIGRRLEAQELLCHPGHLWLPRAAVAAHRLLHLRRRVLRHHEMTAAQRAEDHAPRFADPHGGAPVGREEQQLERRALTTLQPTVSSTSSGISALA